MEKLKILLIEDTEVHRQAAITQLKDHELVICNGYNEFTKYLGVKKQRGGKFEKPGVLDATEFDVILTDCLMPPDASSYVYQEGHSKENVPYGAIILLWAIQNNISKAGLLMLNNHHDHPIAAGLDILGHKDVRKYGNSEILISTGDYYDNAPDGEFLSSKLRNTEGRYVKNWGDFLLKLTGEATW